MIRKLLLPALLVGLLGGCVTDYGYRDGYYYGRPGVEYRYYDYGYPYGAYPYGYGYYPYGGYRYYNYYHSPYYGPYRHPYYYNPHYGRHRYPKPPVTGTPGPQPGGDNDDRDNRRPPTWRDLDRRRPVGEPQPQNRVMVPSQPQPQPQPQVRPAPRREQRAEGSPMRQIMQRTQETRRRSSGDTEEP